MLALIIAGLLVPNPLLEMEREQEHVFDQISGSVVFVSTAEGFGSGFFVNDNGLILTSAHVMGTSIVARVITPDGRSYEGRLYKRADNNIDLVLIKIRARGTVPLKLLEKANLRVGAWVASVGHGKGGIWSFNSGMISNIYPDGADRPVFQTQIPLNPGNSGGPVVDTGGRVLGVVTARMTGAEGINFAIRSEVALQCFPELSGVFDGLTIVAPKDVPVFVNGQLAGVGPRATYQPEPGVIEVYGVINGTIKRLSVRFPERRLVELR
jgi:S1-C subfamily serine protease